MLSERFVTAKGVIEPAVATEGWIRPSRVELRDDLLFFSYARPFRRVRTRDVRLFDFVKLADATPEQIRSFGSRCGTLDTIHIGDASGQGVGAPATRSKFDEILQR